MRNIFIVFLLLSTYSFSLGVTSQTLANKTHKIGWYFWEVRDQNTTLYYLANGRKANNIRVWNFTADKKWKPIHNAPTFDGFTKANKNFKSVSFSSTGDQITFTDKTISVNIAIDYYLETLKNQTFDIVWYFWESEATPFLASGRGAEAGMKIWQYTTGGKWRPVHNAGAFDGFPAAGKVFDDVEIDKNGWTINIVKSSYNIPTPSKDPSLPKGNNIYPTFSVYSKDFKTGEDFAGGFPHIRWANLPAHTASIAIEIVDTSATEYRDTHYRVINIPADSNTSISSAEVADPAIVLPNDFADVNLGGAGSFQTIPAKRIITINVYAVKIATATSFLHAKENALSHRTLIYRTP